MRCIECNQDRDAQQMACKTPTAEPQRGSGWVALFERVQCLLCDAAARFAGGMSMLASKPRRVSVRWMFRGVSRQTFTVQPAQEAHGTAAAAAAAVRSKCRQHCREIQNEATSQPLVCSLTAATYTGCMSGRHRLVLLSSPCLPDGVQFRDLPLPGHPMAGDDERDEAPACCRSWQGQHVLLLEWWVRRPWLLSNTHCSSTSSGGGGRGGGAARSSQFCTMCIGFGLSC